MNTDFIKLGKWSGRLDTISVPAIIVDAGRGKSYSIQYGGCACNHCIVKGELFELPEVKFGDPQGSIFNSSLWYNHVLSHLFNVYCSGHEQFRLDAPKRDFLYNLIEEEIQDRCMEFANDKRDIFAKKWTTKYTKIKIIREWKENNEAMMMVSLVDGKTKRRGVLTWNNCD